MDREILFRGKRKSSRKIYQTWVYGSLFLEKKYCSIQFCEKDNGDIDDVDVIPKTVGQYTGVVTDEESIRIYKDDIIRFNDGNVSFVGRVDKECGAWGIVADDIPLDYKYACQNDNFISFWEIMWNANNPDLILDDIVPYVRVIGNIHDNPELLKGEVDENDRA